MRFFSSTIDLGRMTILGGSLTNWPATRDVKSGRTLLRPIELSMEGAYKITEYDENEWDSDIVRQSLSPEDLMQVCI